MKKINLTVVILMIVSGLCGQSTIYIDSGTGNDVSGDGSSGNPYKTFHKGYTMAISGDILDLTGTFTWTDADETGDAATTGYTIAKNLTIQGQGAGLTFIQSASTENTADRRVFTLSGGYDITIKDVTIRYGKDVANGEGGGIYSGTSGIATVNITSCNIEYNRAVDPSSFAEGGGGICFRFNSFSSGRALNIDKCNIRHNRVDPSGATEYGGGIYARHTNINITNSTISNNISDAHGGGIYTYYANLTITNSTIAHNECNGSGGAGSSYGDVTYSGSVLHFTNVTIAENNTTSGNYDGYNISGSNSELYIKNCILGNNDAGYDFAQSSATIYNNGYNIVESSYNYTFNATGDITGNQANLWGTGISATPPLADNGTFNGTQTIASSSGSVAINAGATGTNGSVSVPSYDQRGYGRNGNTDIGAYEYDGSNPYIATWTGGTSTDWNTQTNWDIGIVPTSVYDVSIPDVVNDPIVDEDPTTPAICSNLSLESDASLTINAGKALTVTGNLTVADAKGPATLSVSSDASGTGSLIVEGTITGEIDFERYVTLDYWHFVSAPVSGQAIDNAFMTASGITSTPAHQFYRWDEDTQYWIIYGSTGNPEAFGDTEFVAGRGYALVRSSDGDLNFTGTPETSDISYASTHTGLYERVGFNLVGNPFSCALGMTNSSTSSGKFLADNTALLDDNYEAAYIWDEQAGYAFDRNDYKVISNAAISGYTQLAQDYIQPGQAFMVKVVTGGGNIEFNADMRAHAGVNFYKKGEEWPSVELLVQGDELYNSTAIGFNDDMTTGLDPSYDVGKLKGNIDIALYTRLVEDNGIDFAVQSLPVSNMEHFIVPVGIDISEPGTFTFTAVTDQMDEVPVILEDRLLGQFTNLKTDSYTVGITEIGTGRFFLRFKNTISTGEEISAAPLQAYCARKNLYVCNPEALGGIVLVTDLAGRQVDRFSLNGDGVQQQSLNANAGIYIVHITTEQGVYRNRVLYY